MTVADLPELEAALEKLIREHGIDKLNEAISPLLGTHLNWPDWQRVSHLAHRIHRRIQKREEPTRPNRHTKK